MTHVAALAPERPVPTRPLPRIETRFGPIQPAAGRIIRFAKGLFGFADQLEYVLVDVPEREVPFKLLQAVDAAEPGFLVLPLERDDGPIARADLESAARSIGFTWETLAVLGIVTLRSQADGVRCTVNLKAPLLIDSLRRQGRQCVLASDAYDVRQALPLGADHAG